MGLRELITAIVFVFILAVFIMVAAPTIEGVSEPAKNMSAVDGSHWENKIDLVMTVSLVFVPTMGLGFVLWALTAAAFNESFGGRRPR